MEPLSNADGNTEYKKYKFPLCPFSAAEDICKFQHQGDRHRDSLSPENVRELVRTMTSLFHEGFGPDNKLWSLLFTVIAISTHCTEAFFNVPIVWCHLPKEFPKEWLLHLLSAVCSWPYMARNYFGFDDIKKLIIKSFYAPTIFFVDPKTYDKNIQKCYLENPSERTQFLYDKCNFKEYLYSYRIVLAEYPPNSYSNQIAVCLDLPDIHNYPNCDNKRIEAIREVCQNILATFERPLQNAVKELGSKAPAYNPSFSLYALSMALKEIGAIEESEFKSICELLEKLEIRSKRNYGYDEDKDVLWLIWDYIKEHTAEGSPPSDIVKGYIILERLTSFIAAATRDQVLVAPKRISEILNDYNLILERKRLDLEPPSEVEERHHALRRIQRTGVIIDEAALNKAISRGY